MIVWSWKPPPSFILNHNLILNQCFSAQWNCLWSYMSRTSWGSGRRFSAGPSLKDIWNLAFVTGSAEHSHEPVERKQELGLSLNSSMCKLARVFVMLLFISSKLKPAHGWFAWDDWWAVLSKVMINWLQVRVWKLGDWEWQRSRIWILLSLLETAFPLKVILANV